MLTPLLVAALALPPQPGPIPSCPDSVTFAVGAPIAVPVAARSAAYRRDACADPADTTRRRRAAQHSDAYYTRLAIHRYASYAMLPLFIAQYIVGQDLFDDSGDGEGGDDDGGGNKSLHVGLGVSIGVLFGVNTITGGWNLVEGWHDTGVKQKAHAALMLLADAGFLATALVTPDDGENKSTHRALAITSGATALVGYALMIPDLFH